MQSRGSTRRLVLGLLVATLLTALSSTTAAASPEDDLRNLDSYVDQAYAAVLAGDLAQARAAYAAYDRGWVEIEDGVKARSRPAYRAIEDAMSDVKIALATEPVDTQKAAAAILELDRRGHQFIAGQEVTAQAPTAIAGDNQARLAA